ncbi:uncharacterized protein HMPREF1541_11052 [Cyphellophora europaea CBS 101466]|uniref:Major facilitator superfamily (MFS) profile domain-containing protein n=1 Tax=Cyphellophora europaea (strain CBS 101466) TaxID=1220924 RepID=W2S5F2_CYPE1|nr:uncharacterized protein HMPREF1541_11052 [Cyphellophora europaea CBS 101466]ETN43921.1 hypothetical protein HMPREF1541_11052 [Cyphellophora europaea CBS 101466]
MAVSKVPDSFPAEKELVHQEKVVTSDNPAETHYYEQFVNNGEAWRSDFEKKLVRKVDWRLIPLLIIMYLNNFIDRAALGQARLSTLEEDLGMSGTDFNLSISILFVGYLTMQLPSNLLITRVRPSLYLGVTMAVWGAVCACTAAVQNLSGLIVVRIFLGVTEAPFFPGAIFLMSSWYTRTELTRRIAWFYGGVALANMFGGLIAAGVLSRMEGAMGVAAWRWLFIINGAITIFFAITCIFIIPNFPKNTKWLTEEQQAYAQWRLKQDAEEEDDSGSTSLWQGLKLCLTDYRMYIFMLMQHLSILSQTFQYLFPSIVQTLGYGRIETLLLTVPVWFGTWCVAILVTWTADRFTDRSIHIMCLLGVSAIGNAIVGSTLNVGARFFGMFLMPMGAVSAYQIIVAWVANSFIRPMVKRSSAIAICNAIGNCASIYGTYFYPSAHEPGYTPGSAANAGVCVVVALLALSLRFIHKWENKKLGRVEREGFSGEEGADRRGFGFRYVY